MRRPPDLKPSPLPNLDQGFAVEGEILSMLYGRIEQSAVSAVDWYLKDRKGKKRWSRTLRCLAIVLAGVGGLLPLLPQIPSVGSYRDWGYVALAGAAGLVAFDHLFGLSAGWMRDIGAAQDITARLEELQLDWSAYKMGLIDTSEMLMRLRRFSRETSFTVRSETSTWQTQLQGSLARLNNLTANSQDRSDLHSPLPGRSTKAG